MITMSFIATTTEDGLIHVQNYVMGMRGQHHVHTQKGFNNWKNIAKIRDREVKTNTGTCPCELKSGDVKEYDGRIWHNQKFE